MGGEQWPILVYGSKETNTMTDWLLKLGAVNVKEFAKSVRESGEDENQYSDMDLFIDCYEENQEDVEKLLYLLKSNKMIMVYFSNFGWDEFSIGLEVKDYESLTSEDTKRVRLLCEKYKLGMPTLYAGIVGEEE